MHRMAIGLHLPGAEIDPGHVSGSDPVPKSF